MTRYLPALFFLSFSISIIAEQGDVYFADRPVINVRAGPSLGYPVVVKIERGRQVVEQSREGNWAEVLIDGEEAASWIYLPLLTAEYMDGQAKKSESPGFNQFLPGFNDFKNRLEEETGLSYFTDAEYLGDRVIQITATGAYINETRSEKENKLAVLFGLWDEADGTGSSIGVYVINENGEKNTYMMR